MKLPNRIRSYITDADFISLDDKSDLTFYLNSIKDTLPEFPSPSDAERIVKGAMKTLKIKLPKSEKEPPKEKPKEEKKPVKESVNAETTGNIQFKFIPKRRADNLDSIMVLSGRDAEILADMLGAHTSRVEKLGSTYAIFKDGELKLFKNASDYSEEE